ncbi:hypothetical protein FD724_34250 (plasmid) [Nostoc sp. C057]|uniref:hypothetical protein n=1 Tax=Nostoc sp. C057 TaxID=2576903 RepID=UPI0015C30F4C|nr:hypothetical protein [Nostoc sp. C057]QLE53015.1 hypothetical protein FD724_34250 [Nostoc sp. C057]
MIAPFSSLEIALIKGDRALCRDLIVWRHPCEGGSSTTKRDDVPALCQRSPSLIFYDLLYDR